MKFKKTDLYNFVNKLYEAKVRLLRFVLDGVETETTIVARYYPGFFGNYNLPPEPPDTDILKIFVRGVGEVDEDQFLSIENKVRAELDENPLSKEEFWELVEQSVDDRVKHQ